MKTAIYKHYRVLIKHRQCSGHQIAQCHAGHSVQLATFSEGPTKLTVAELKIHYQTFGPSVNIQGRTKGVNVRQVPQFEDHWQWERIKAVHKNAVQLGISIQRNSTLGLFKAKNSQAKQDCHFSDKWPFKLKQEWTMMKGLFLYSDKWHNKLDSLRHHKSNHISCRKTFRLLLNESTSQLPHISTKNLNSTNFQISCIHSSVRRRGLCSSIIWMSVMSAIAHYDYCFTKPVHSLAN